MIWSQETRASEAIAMPRLVSILLERKMTVAFCILVGFCLAAVGYLYSPKRYQAEAILALDVRKLQALPSESVVSSLPQESPALRTELDIIGSRMMAERVVRLLKDKDASRGVTAGVSDTPAPLPAQNSLSADDQETRDREMINDLISHVGISNDGRSLTIYISFKADTPEYAALVANAYGEAYIDYQIDLKTSATRRVSEWLGDSLVNLRTKLEQSERLATDFREKAGIVKIGNTTLKAEQIAGLNNELTTLRARLAGSEARLATALDTERGDDNLALAEVLASPTIQALRTEEARTKRAISEIDESGAIMNPQLPQLKSQLASLKTQINAEIEQIIDSLRNEIVSMKRQEAGIETNLRKMQEEMSETNQALVHADQLDREASANRSIYESYLTRYKQTIEQDGIVTAEARMISRAIPPGAPTSPNLKFWILLGLVTGSAAGVAAAFLLDRSDKSVRSAEALETRTGLAVIGRIPKLSARERADTIGMVRDGKSNFGQALADLQAQLRLGTDSAPSRVVAVGSAIDREGKTLIAANLARSLAATGVKTIVIDANLRSPSIDQEFGAKSPNHLEQVIFRGLALEKAIQNDPVSGVDFIAARESAVPTEFLLGNRQFACVIGELRQRYELIIIDTPAIAAGQDLMRIASLADTTALVVRWEATDMKQLQLSVKKLRAARRNICGIILNGSPRQGKLPNQPAFYRLSPNRTAAQTPAIKKPIPVAVKA
ncbi:polysaccharide biosynthesis tyrosine autokinase [Rhizobium sp. BK251]|uniref:GumC family protein n=1 Tax=Rhizobium sp. BK251 TaxID=2512125 RepID=UPI00104ED68E|nr:polysaccharide biosynthesis tyrosine autokinase [Rhizobium sp. BK251]TCL74550.1 capsular exopolysaccharide synthesis family protein [Rhizobium sp. BK251]